jgi:sugar/nucleoside kinase (ribokinase family)
LPSLVLCLGEALVDYMPAAAAGHEPMFGGSQANIAIGAARFGAGAALAGRAGDDERGRWLRDVLARERVDVSSFVLQPGVETQHAFVTVSSEGEPEFSFFGGTPEGCLPDASELIPRVTENERGVLVFGSDSLIAERDRATAMELKERALAAGWQVLFDPNLRRARWPDEATMLESALAAIEGVAVVKANASEAVLLTECVDAGAGATALQSLGARVALVTTGPGGAILADGAGELEKLPSKARRVIDATGAGDAVAAVVAAALAQGRDVSPAVVEIAMGAAARVVAERGALTGLPPEAEARRMLRGGP